MGTIGNLRHKGVFIHNVYIDNGFGGQEKVTSWSHPCAVSIIGSNGKEMFQNEAIFNIKTLSVLCRVCDTMGITAGDKIEIDSVEYNINDVELYEKDRGYHLLRVSRELITGD